MTLLEPSRTGHRAEAADHDGLVYAAARRLLDQTTSTAGDLESRADAYGAAVDEAIREVNRSLVDVDGDLIAETEREGLRERVVARLAGLGTLAVLLADDAIEDITCNGCDVVWVTRADGSKAQVGPVASSDAELIAAVQMLAAGAGLSDTERRFDRAAPALDLQLPDGSRLHAVRDVAHRPSVSIRRHRLTEASLDQLQAGGMFSRDIAELLKAAVAAKLNIIIAGPMAAGKTTLLRALAGLLDYSERIVTIEDAYELGLHTDSRHGNVVAMQARPANIEGAGEVSAWDLFHEALRMRPDRVLVGEVRGPEVAVMLDAMSTGTDGSMSTIHTSSSAGVFRKIKTHARKPPAGLDPEATADLIGGSLDLVVQIALRGGRRWVSSIREVVGSEGSMVASNELYAPDAAAQTAVFATPVSAARAERLAEHGWRPPGSPARRW
ncbi:CpaF family protein [Glycomyces sp. MUSA5-2]|uniref:CpaF family protein n=1 Tax=Glycomyces sp. MUSA5-2 TaxID=2053002 RepID=UPI003009C0A4